MHLFWIGLGGALGTLARYAICVWSNQRFGGFPYGTLAVNVLGSFLLGVIMQLSATTDLVAPTVRLALGTGVMGGFTTYSTFNHETLKFVQERAWSSGALNVGATLAGCWVGGALGIALGSALAGLLGGKRLAGG